MRRGSQTPEGDPESSEISINLSTDGFSLRDRGPLVGALLGLMPLRLSLATYAGQANRHQAQVIGDLVEENRVPKGPLRDNAPRRPGFAAPLNEAAARQLDP